MAGNGSKGLPYKYYFLKQKEVELLLLFIISIYG